MTENQNDEMIIKELHKIKLHMTNEKNSENGKKKTASNVSQTKTMAFRE